MTNRERGFWRVRAIHAIEKVIGEFIKEKRLDPFEALQPSEKAELLKRIDDAYPFGIRAYHPYKVWLSVRAEYKYKFKIAPPKPKTYKTLAKKSEYHPNQLSLFD